MRGLVALGFVGVVGMALMYVLASSARQLEALIEEQIAQKACAEAERVAKAEAQSQALAEDGQAEQPPDYGRLRMYPGEKCVSLLCEASLGEGIRQIPSTVIDVGILKNVPYKSYRSGEREFNFYGDPAAPSCVEAGLCGADKTDAAARRECVATVAKFLTRAEDREFLATLDLTQDKNVREGLTFEVTPPEAEDAYGGWWVSVYDENALDAARAGEAELKRITEPRAEIEKRAPSPATTQTGWTSADLAHARPSGTSTVVVTSTPTLHSPVLAQPKPASRPTTGVHIGFSRTHRTGSVFVGSFHRTHGTYTPSPFRSTMRIGRR